MSCLENKVMFRKLTFILLFSNIDFTIVSCNKSQTPALNFSIDGRWEILEMDNYNLVGNDNYVDYSMDKCCIDLSDSNHAIVTGTRDEQFTFQKDSVQTVTTSNEPFYVTHDSIFNLQYTTPGGVKIYYVQTFQFSNDGTELSLFGINARQLKRAN